MFGAMSPKSHIELARGHLNRALDVVETDKEAAALWLFFAAEQALESIAALRGIDTKRNHQTRIAAAKQLAADGLVPETTADLLDTLNEARKATTYEGEPLDLKEWSLEDAVVATETLVERAEEESA
jgi:hypothetical protein